MSISDAEIPNLTIKRERFAQEYVRNGGNASAAYRHAFDCEKSSEATVGVHSCNLKKNAKVKLRITQIQAEYEQAACMSAQWVLSKLTKALDYADAKKSAFAMTQTVNEINKMLGYHKQEALSEATVTFTTKAEIPDNGREVK